MISLHPAETERLEALRQYDVLDTAPELEFDDLAHLAAQICGTPISAITLVDENRQWFKSRLGLEVPETPRDVSFCAHALLEPDLLIVADASTDERFADNPLVTGDPHLRFYAGMPLVTPEGQAIGTLCVLDKVPRQLDQAQQDALRRLARQTVALLEARPATPKERSQSRRTRHEAERQRLTLAANEARRIADNLTTSETRYRRLFETAKDGILILDAATGQIEDVNPYLCQLLGYQTDEFLGKHLWEIGAFRDIAASQSAFRTLQDKQYIRYDDLPLETKAGQSTSVEFISNVYLSGDKKVVQCNIRDITERKRTKSQIERQLQQISALRSIDMAITGSLDLRVTLNVLLDHVTSQLKVDAAAVLLFDSHTQTLDYSVGRGFRSSALQNTHLRLSDGHAGRAARERRLVYMPDLTQQPGDLTRAPLLSQEGFITYFGVPLLAKGQIEGVLEIFHRTLLEPEQQWLDFLQALAGQAAIAIDNGTLFDGLQRSNTELALAYDTTIEGWSRALDLRDKATEGHTLRVTAVTLRLARALNLSSEELVQIRRGALLHDIGKMGIPDAILLKPGPLTDEEWVIMRRHPVYAFELLSPIAYLRLALDIPYCHHEKWDGSGYPRGLSREQIPLSARLFAVIDVWDALRSDRPYRVGWPEEKVRQHIAEGSGTHFDPQVVQAFIEMKM